MAEVVLGVFSYPLFAQQTDYPVEEIHLKFDPKTNELSGNISRQSILLHEFNSKFAVGHLLLLKSKPDAGLP